MAYSPYEKLDLLYHVISLIFTLVGVYSSMVFVTRAVFKDWEVACVSCLLFMVPLGPILALVNCFLVWLVEV